MYTVYSNYLVQIYWCQKSKASWNLAQHLRSGAGFGVVNSISVAIITNFLVTSCFADKIALKCFNSQFALNYNSLVIKMGSDLPMLQPGA